jgi:hypothetical protein
MVPLPRSAGTSAPSPEFEAELQKRQKALADGLAAQRDEAARRVRALLPEYLDAQRHLERYPVEGFDVVLSKGDLIPASLRRWATYLADLADASASQDPVFAPWFAFAALNDEEFTEHATEASRRIASTEATLNPRIRQAFSDPPASPREVADRYGQVFAEIDRQWREACEAAKREGRSLPTSLADSADEELRQILYGPHSPCIVPDEPMVNIEFYFDSKVVVDLWKLQGEVDRWLLQSPESSPQAVILTDRDRPDRPRIFRRGNAANLGDEVPRQFPQILAGNDRRPFSNGSGRLELAQSIIAPSNPLTVRVWVNRVWQQHFGEGLVRTPSDFGLRAEPPSHPELLDWLASTFVEHGWSTKDLHRLIMLSEVYRQSSFGPSDPAQLNQAQQVDLENRLLWRMNSHRLGFEEMRDSLLAASGELDLTMRGKPVENFPEGSSGLRRSVYGLVDRQFLPGVLRVFDFANPDLHAPQRSETTVPQQALFALNHPFVANRTRSLAQRISIGSSETAADDRVRRLFATVFQREPTPKERDAAATFTVSAKAEKAAPPVPPGATAWSYGFGEPDDATGKLKSFQPMPHFTGSAWQGGAQWPDTSLGWVQLTAQGGHPGNDLSHAAVRRWTAPRDMTVSVHSVAVHEPAAGDGIRCRILSSRAGELASIALHNDKQHLDVDSIQLHAGDTLDFVVDLNANLNSDQFLWSPRLEVIDRRDGQNSAANEWNAERDFVGPRDTFLDPWEQLAQVLLLSNEFLFVD